MNTIVINSHNIAPFIVEDSYQMDSQDQYESWQDGNWTEHRIIVASKVSGSFDVVCNNKEGGLSVATLMGYLTDGTDPNVALCGVWVTNKGVSAAIYAYYTITNKQHTLAADGSYIDVLTVELKER